MASRYPLEPKPDERAAVKQWIMLLSRLYPCGEWYVIISPPPLRPRRSPRFLSALCQRSTGTDIDSSYFSLQMPLAIQWIVLNTFKNY